jgi:23S rRNA maturation mini-RNase III
MVACAEVNPVLPPVPFLDGKAVRANWNAVALAFLGDSVWEVRMPAPSNNQNAPLSHPQHRQAA